MNFTYGEVKGHGKNSLKSLNLFKETAQTYKGERSKYSKSHPINEQISVREYSSMAKGTSMQTIDMETYL